MDSGVNASHLSLFEKPDVKDVSAYLHEQDATWVDRGSLANLLAVWRAHALDKILRADRKRAGADRITRRSAEGGVCEEPREVRYLT